MNRTARLLAAAPGVALLAWAAFNAVDYGVAGAAAGNATRELARARYGPALDDATWWSVDVQRALRSVPSEPTLRELDALVTLRTSTDFEKLEAARREVVQAVAARPGSGYAWSTLATLDYRLGETGTSFEKALVNAQRLAPYEPEVQQVIVDYGLAVIDEVQPSTRAAIERAVTAGMKRNAPEILQIAARRGRLDVACRHLDGPTRPAATKWTQFCQSMEATS